MRVASEGRGAHRRLFPVLLCWLASVSLCLSAPASGRPKRSTEAAPTANAQTAFIDFLHPEAFRGSTWIQIGLPSSRVLLSNLRIITANRSWSLQICGSVSNPGSCVNALASWDPRGAGWRGDFLSAAWSQSYQDLDAGKMLHLRVTPLTGDWMIFRIQVEATPTP